MSSYSFVSALIALATGLALGIVWRNVLPKSRNELINVIAPPVVTGLVGLAVDLVLWGLTGIPKAGTLVALGASITALGAFISSLLMYFSQKKRLRVILPFR